MVDGLLTRGLLIAAWMAQSLQDRDQESGCVQTDESYHARHVPELRVVLHHGI